jgi:TonB family protein
LFALLAAAASIADDSANEFVKAKPSKRDKPEYPYQDLKNRNQAWVDVAFCIDEAGTTQNIKVIDSVGNERFENAAIETVRQWTYEPALAGGKPAWQSRNHAVISFALKDSNDGVRRTFLKQFRKLEKLHDQEKLQEADELFWQVHSRDDLSLYELSKLWQQRARYEQLRGDLAKLDVALHRATASLGRWNDEDSYVKALRLRIETEVRIGQYRTALGGYRSLVTAAGEDSKDVLALKPVMEKLRDMINSDKPFRISAEVREKGGCYRCNDSWAFVPARNDFTFSNVDGKLQSIEWSCDRKHDVSEVAERVKWHIPDDWGACLVQVNGDPGTTFDVVMLPGT